MLFLNEIASLRIPVTRLETYRSESAKTRFDVTTRLTLVFALTACGLAGQNNSSPALPPRFGLVTAEPFIRKTVQQTKFIEAVGRRGALLGREDGTLEAWINPVKILRDFRLTAFLDNSLQGLPLSELAETVTVTPGRTTITHSHAAFTIRQTWFAPLDRQALIVLLDIESPRPLRLRASFVPELRPMAPASFGGRSFAWSANDHMFIMTDGTRRQVAVVGSPLFDRGSEEPAVLEMEVTPDIAQSRLIPILIAASSAGEEAARKVYRETLASLQDLVAESDAYYRDLQAKTMRIQTPEPALNHAFEWAKFAIEKGWTCNERIGCGLVSGFGPSGTSDKPGPAWYSGADALINSWSIVDYGDLDRARAVLEFLRERQRPDGKMFDQLTQSAALIDPNAYPPAYQRGEATALYLFSVARYVVRSGDREFLRASWASLEKAYRYCISALDGDGLILTRRAGSGAVEGSALANRISKDIYLQGAWLAGLDGYAILADLDQHPHEVAESRKRLELARKSLESWFHPDRGYFPFARLDGGGIDDRQSSWQALALAYGGIDSGKAEKASASLSRAQLTTPWGARTFATDPPQRDANSRFDNSVWPLMTAFTSLAEFRNHHSRQAIAHLYSMAELTGFAGTGFIPQDLSGERAQTMPNSAPHQLLSSSAVVHPVVRGLLGLGGDAFEGTFSFVPHLPPHWPLLRFELYRIGQSWVSGEVTHQTGLLQIRLTVIGKPLKMYLAPALPVGTTVKTVKVNGKKVTARQEASGQDVHLIVELNPAMGAEVTYQLREGVEARPDLPAFEVGQAATPVQTKPISAVK
jgi:glycogen debranching enzyme